MTKKILVEVSELLTISPSKLIIVYGENGCGKTTLLKKIALSNIFPDKNVQLECEVAYLGHKFGIKHQQTINDYLFFCLGIIDKSYLTRYNLKQNARIQDISFGQIQKVGLVRVLMSKKPLWILDEPFSNVDENSKNLFLEDLSQYLSSGGAAIIASHETFSLPHESVYL